MTTANAIKDFYNNHFFNGDTPVPRVLSMKLTDGQGSTADFPTVELSPGKVFSIGHLDINLETPITLSISLAEGQTISLPPMMISTGRTALDDLFKAAHRQIAEQKQTPPAEQPTPAPEEGTTQEEAEAEELPEIIFDDFEQILYGRTEKSQKTYYLEKLKPEVAKQMGQGYRIYKDPVKGEEVEYLNPKGPVYRGIVKEYEIKHGLRKE